MPHALWHPTPPRWTSATRRLVLLLASGLLVLAASAGPASAIPAFARKYKVSCSLCHAPFPRLTEFGGMFAANGFEMAVGEAPVDTVDTGDPWLRLQRNVPLAIRLDAYMTGLVGNSTVEAVDLQTPYLIKLMSGGQIYDGISYYFYFYLAERGEVAGVEDAYVQFTEIGGSPISVMAGQFQVSDPMFKRELRLSYEDYHIYRVRIGEARNDLAYDRGFMVLLPGWSGADFTFQAVNGNGLSDANEERLYDNDRLKNYGLKFNQSVGSSLRLGLYGYYGNEKSDGINDEVVILGPDLTWALTPKWELNAQYLRRTDGNPFFLDSCDPGDFRCDASASNPFRVTTDMAMAELLFFPRGQGERWAVWGLYNFTDADRQAVSLRLGEQDGDPPFISRYQYLATGLGYLLARNLRLTGELGYNFELEAGRAVLGFVAGF